MVIPNRAHKGFTLIELIMVIVVLGVVSVGIGGFIRSGVQIFVDVSERDQLLSQSRFVVERLNRELRNAVPGSARVIRELTNIHCLEFVPIETSVFYNDIPVLPELLAPADVLELYPYTLQGDEFAVVYPTSSEDVFDVTEGKRKSFTCSDEGSGDCSLNDDPDHVVQLTVGSLFKEDSPAARLYVVRNAVSYCLRPDGPGSLTYNIYRHEGSINAAKTAYNSGGVLMAEGIKNSLSTDEFSPDNPFRVADATLTRNAVVYTLLRFSREDEQIVLVNEVHIPNVP
jgi:MSHA biogenesis protein MshO